MDPSSTPYMLTVRCSLSTNLPTIIDPTNIANVLQEPPVTRGLEEPLQSGTIFSEASATRKGFRNDDTEGASTHPRRLSGGFIVESSLKITSPTKGDHSSSPTKVWRTSRNLIPSTSASGDVARKALRKHRKRLARIVVDQWLYAARHRLLATRLRNLRNDQLLKACLEAWRRFRNAKQIERQAQELRVLAIRRRRFREWIAFLHQQHERKKMEVDVIRKLCRNKLRAAWNSWTAFLKRDADRFLEDDAKELSMSQKQDECSTTESSCSLDSISDFHLASLLSRAFEKWTKYLSSVRKWNNIRDQLADSHDRSRNIRKVFRGIRRVRGRRRVKLAHMKLAEDHWNFQELRRRLQIWHSACGILYARRNLKNRAVTKRRQWLMSAGFGAWTDYIWGKSQRRARVLELQNRFLKLNMIKVWNSWMSVRDVLQLDRMNQELADHLFRASRLRAAFHAWLAFLEHRKKRSKEGEKAEAFLRKRLAKLALLALKQNRLLQMIRRAAATDAMLHRQATLERNAFLAWKDWLAGRHQKQEDEKEALAAYSNILQRWACERVLTYGIREQSLKLNKWLEIQAARLVASLSQVAPYAKKWSSRIKKRPNGVGSRAGTKPALEFPTLEAMEMNESVHHDKEDKTRPSAEKERPVASRPSLMDIRPLPRPPPRRPSYLS